MANKKNAAAVALRLAGASYQEIADALVLDSPNDARNAVECDLRDRANDADLEKRELLRAQTAARLERLLRGVWGKATNPQDPEHLIAVTRALAIIDRHTKLYGLDAPAEVMVHTPTSVEIEAWVAAVTSATATVQIAEPDIFVIEGEVVNAG